MSYAAPCNVRILDTQLTEETWKSCPEYAGYVRSPFQSVPLRQLWNCQQENWRDAFREWGVLQLFVGITVACLNAIIGLTWWPGHVFVIAFELILQIVLCVLFSHLTWFGVVKRPGCCCCCVVCCEGHPLVLVWAAFATLYGFMGIIVSAQSLSWLLDLCHLCALSPLLYAVHAITLIYMGIAASRIWQGGPDAGLNGGILPSAPAPVNCTVLGPAGEVVGIASVVLNTCSQQEMPKTMPNTGGAGGSGAGAPPKKEKQPGAETAPAI